MTEAEWLAATDPESMTLKGLDKLKAGVSRVPAFLATFCEAGRVRQLLSPEMRGPFDDFVRWAQEGGPHPSTIYPQFTEFDPLARQRISTWQVDEEVARLIGFQSYSWWSPFALIWIEASDQQEVTHLYRWRELQSDTAQWLKLQAARLREVVGNPFRPIAFDPRWRSETVVALATTIYAERAFDRLPILADALEEAACDHSDILNHCRGPGPHVRGCWVVDLVLGKE